MSESQSRSLNHLGDDPLFSWLRSRMAISAISEIAGQDYGMGHDVYWHELKGIVDSGVIPIPLESEGAVEMALIRSDRLGSVTIAFCAWLSIYLDVHGAGSIPADDSWALLLVSCDELGGEALAGLSAFARAAGHAVERRFDDAILSHYASVLAELLGAAPRAKAVEGAAKSCLDSDRASAERLAEIVQQSFRTAVWRDLSRRGKRAASRLSLRAESLGLLEGVSACR